jgi:hypothetical protein
MTFLNTTLRTPPHEAHRDFSRTRGFQFAASLYAERLFALALCACLTPFALSAQPWNTVQQGSTWYGGFVDHALTDRSALWFDTQWRRMGVAAEPQQLLIRPGVQYTITPGVRVGAGYAFIATAPYGEAPIAQPLREHRVWQQLLLSHRAGALSVSHRYRWEQRWLQSVAGDDLTPSQYQQRARYMVRAQGELPGLRVGSRAVLGFVWDELLMPVGHADATLRVTQNRLGGGIGVPINAAQRVEVGYMNLWNALPGRRVNEVNHTLTLSWVWTKASPPPLPGQR